jgi:hypothetical protein
MKLPGNRNSILLSYLLIVAVAVLRLTVSHPYNFIPIFSCLLFFGAMRPWREFPMAFLSLVGVDMFLTTHRYGYFVTADHAVTWAWYLAMLLVGAGLLRSTLSLPRAAGATLGASVSFFIVSNFAVWAVWGMYPKTWSGLVACYVAALPFFRNSVVSETACALAVFGLARYSEAFMPAMRARRAC